MMCLGSLKQLSRILLDLKEEIPEAVFPEARRRPKLPTRKREKEDVLVKAVGPVAS